MNNIVRLFCLMAGVSVLTSACTSETRKRLEPTPTAIGTLSQLVVITDEDIWRGPVGDSIKYYFESAFPILPTPEPIFDLKHFTPEDLAAEKTRKELKAYLIVGDISDTESATTNLIAEDLGSERYSRALSDSAFHTSVGKDRWAQDQVVVYLFDRGRDALAKQVVRTFPAIAKVIQDQYERQIDATVYQYRTNEEAMMEVFDLCQCHIAIPGDYRINMNQDSVIWLIREHDLAISNIMIKVMPYENQAQFNRDNIIDLRDKLGRYVSSSVDGSYMKTNPVDLPVYTQATQLGGGYAVEVRGIWEMEGDYAGGPFLSYLVLDENSNRLIYIDSFVLAPGERKRNLMLFLEHIANTFAFSAPR